MKLLDGRATASKIQAQLKEAIHSLIVDQGWEPPHLHVILVGDDFASKRYVSRKHKVANDLGISVTVYTYAEDIVEGEVIELIRKLNTDPRATATMVQLPLPAGWDTERVLNEVLPIKDVDALSEASVARLGEVDIRQFDIKNSLKLNPSSMKQAPLAGHKYVSNGVAVKNSLKTNPSFTTQALAASQSQMRNPSTTSGEGRHADLAKITDFIQAPATPTGIMFLLDQYKIDLAGKRAVVVGQGRLVGKPLAQLWRMAGADVAVADIHTTNTCELTQKADILAVATGQPELIDGRCVKNGAVVIDAGIHRRENTDASSSTSQTSLIGDVNFDAVSRKASYITPVPGGVGPMTVAALMWNVYMLWVQQYASLVIL